VGRLPVLSRRVSRAAYCRYATSRHNKKRTKVDQGLHRWQQPALDGMVVVILCGDFEAGWCGGLMADIDVDSEGLFFGPVGVGSHGFDAGPFEKSDQEAGGEDFGHEEKFWRFGIERGNGLRGWQEEFVLVTDAGFQRFFQFSAPDLPGDGGSL
jgi:hypothetical protein